MYHDSVSPTFLLLLEALNQNHMLKLPELGRGMDLIQFHAYKGQRLGQYHWKFYEGDYGLGVSLRQYAKQMVEFLTDFKFLNQFLGQIRSDVDWINLFI